MERKGFEVWNSSRTIKKAFLCNPDLGDVIKKANEVGISGNRLVLEASGTDIDNSECVDYYCTKVFMLLEQYQKWTPEIKGVSVNSSNDTLDIDSLIDDVTLENQNTEIIIQPHPKVFMLLDEHDKWKPETKSTSVYRQNATLGMNSLIDVTADTSKNDYTDIVIQPGSTLQGHNSIQNLSSESNSDNSGQSALLDDSILEKNLQASKYLFMNYCVPYSKMSNHITSCLKDGFPLKDCLTAFIHIVVDDMREIKKFIPYSVFCRVAQKVIEEYPKSFGVVDNAGNVLCSEHITLSQRLLNHNNYLNKKQSFKRKRRNTINAKYLRKYARINESCTNWNPISEDSDEDDEEIEKKRLWLKVHAENPSELNNNNSLKEKIDDCFYETFKAQRKFLNNFENPPTIEDTLNKWPILVNSDYIKKHFKKLICNKGDTFSANFNSFKNKIRESCCRKNISKFLINSDISVVEFLVQYYHEDMNTIQKKYQMGTTVDEIIVPVNSPWIASVSLAPQKEVFYVFIEQHNVSCHTELIEALEILLASFYVFNMEYAKSGSLTLETLQQGCVSSTNFSMSTKRNASQKSRVINFIKSITSEC